MKHKITILVMLFLSFINVQSQVQFWSDNFEVVDAPSSGTRIPEQNGGGIFSYFRSTEGQNVSQDIAFANKQGSFYWTGEDHNGSSSGFPVYNATTNPTGISGAPSTSINNELQIEWTGINITGKTGLSFKGLFAANDNNNAWDKILACTSGSAGIQDDYIKILYKIDGGTYQNLCWFLNKGNAANDDKDLYEDTNFDGCGDGVKLTNVFSEFTKTILGTGSTISIKILALSEASGEEWGIDNFRLLEMGPSVIPTLTTSSASTIGSFSATLGGNVISDGGATVIERGIVWGTSINPTTLNTKSIIGSGVGTFNSIITALPIGTLLHFRAFATNSAGTNYGQNLTFTTNQALSATQNQTDASCTFGNDGTATVTVSGGNPNRTYVWSPNFDSFNTASNLTPGSYSCKITDGENTQIIKNFTILQSEGPTVNIEGSDSICSGATTTLSPSFGGIWTSSDLNVATVSNSGVVTGVSQGSATFIFTETSSGCVSNATQQVFVSSVITNDTTVSACDSYLWTNGVNYTTSGNYSYQIDCTVENLFLTINTSTTASETISACDNYTWQVNSQNYTESGTYTFNDINPSGCDLVKTLNLTINNSTNSSQSVTSCNTYLWPENGQTYSNSGNYNFIGTNAAGCNETKTLNLTINNSSIQLTITQNGALLSVAQSGAIYQWYQVLNGTPILISGAINQFYTPTVTGIYFVKVTLNNCPIETSTFAFSNLETSDFDFTTSLRVYPNPTFDLLNVSINSNSLIQITDVLGKIYKTQNIFTGINQLDIGTFTNGVYFLKVINEFNQTKTVKIIKR